jgi:cellulose synthase/poly-beta-1,6-N-acetylglucosamine synthase-like glycosyltransferase
LEWIFLNTVEGIRSFLLLSSLGDVKLIGYPLHIVQGSNFIVRSDVEKEIGWDYRSKAEDLVFVKRVVERYGRKSIGILPGVPHESSLSSFRDYRGQRRRWVEGGLEALEENLSIRSKLEIASGLIGWFSAFPALVSSILNIAFQSGGVFEYSGILFGITLSGLYNFFNTASKIYSSINKNHKKAFSVQKCILSILLENFAPYYSILSKLFSKLLSKSKEEGFYIVKKF